MAENGANVHEAKEIQKEFHLKENSPWNSTPRREVNLNEIINSNNWKVNTVDNKEVRKNNVVKNRPNKSTNRTNQPRINDEDKEIQDIVGIMSLLVEKLHNLGQGPKKNRIIDGMLEAFNRAKQSDTEKESEEQSINMQEPEQFGVLEEIPRSLNEEEGRPLVETQEKKN